MIDAGTLKVPIGITGDRGTCQGKLKTLVKWLLGRGGDELDTDGIKLYSAFIAEGYRKATLSEVSEPEYGYLGDSEILETTLTFNIPNPFDNVTFDGKNFVQQ